MKKHHISFKHAIDGVLVAFKTQPNFQVHLFLSLLSIIAGIILNISAGEWLIISFTIAMGLGFELFNTAIEFTIDLMTQEYKIFAKLAKDTSAAAMLVYAIGALALAAQIFLPKILNLYTVSSLTSSGLWPFI